MGCPALRGLIYAGLAVFAIIFVFAALGTNVAKFKNEGQGFSVTNEVNLWKSCSKSSSSFRGTSPKSCISTTDSDIDCAKFKDNFRAAQAFYILTVLLLPVAIAIGLLDHFKPQLLEKLPMRPKFWLLAVAIALFVLSLIAWAIGVGIPNTSYCGSGKYSDAPGFSYGASPFLMLIAWFAVIAMAVVALVMPPRHPEESMSSASKATHPTNTNEPVR
jgi:hypothetical protein